MADEAKSAEMIALAEALGAMVSAAAQELAKHNLLPRDKLKLAIDAGIHRVGTGRNFASSQEHRDAIAEALRRTALI